MTVGPIVSIIVGVIVAATSVVGFVTTSLNSQSDDPGNVKAGIPYGSTQ
jgi:hypothetical protein